MPRPVRKKDANRSAAPPSPPSRGWRVAGIESRRLSTIGLVARTATRGEGMQGRCMRKHPCRIHPRVKPHMSRLIAADMGMDGVCGMNWLKEYCTPFDVITTHDANTRSHFSERRCVVGSRAGRGGK